MGQMLMPAVIGAGLGAAGGAISGKNPFKTALLGAGLGAGGAGLMGASGAAGATGATGIQLTQPSITEGLSTALAPSVIGGSGAAGITGLGTQALGGAGITGLGSGTLGAGGAAITGLNNIPLNSAINYNNMSRLVANTPLSLGEQFTNIMSNPFENLNTRDKFELGMQGASLFNQPQQRQMEAPPVAPIRPGNPNQVAPSFNLNPSSNLQNVEPMIGAQQGNEIGIPNLKTTIPLTDEELLRLQQMLQTTGFRGR